MWPAVVAREGEQNDTAWFRTKKARSVFLRVRGNRRIIYAGAPVYIHLDEESLVGFFERIAPEVIMSDFPEDHAFDYDNQR